MDWKTLWAAATVSLIMSHGLAVYGATVVSPAGLEFAEGNSSGGGAALAEWRSQHLHLASAFESAPPDLKKITQLALRPDWSVNEPIIVNYEYVEIRFSTTSRTTDDLSTTLAENIGDDEKLVYSGSLTLSTDASGPEGGPKDFDYAIEFDEPFVYDRTEGNLLVEWRIRNRDQGGFFDREVDPGARWQVGARDFDATDGQLNDRALIHQFTIVPEPSTLALAAIGLVGFVVSVWRQRRTV
jgi:hypothetical protein